MTAGRQTEELVPDERLWELKRLYGEFEVSPISYGTVRDFADSLKTSAAWLGPIRT